MAVVRHKEAIHSGHFMVSDFDAECEDEEDIAVPATEEGSNNLPQLLTAADDCDECGEDGQCNPPRMAQLPEPKLPPQMQQIRSNPLAKAIIDVSLNKLFQSMSIAYRQRLTSPKWNRFRGLKLRWKDKIRLNNVIWRCWHMQFIKGTNRLLCAFANPLEIDNHNFPEGGTLLEGKYWKRKLQTIKTEYTRWRKFYKDKCHDDDELTEDQWKALFMPPFPVLEGTKDDAALLAPEEDFFVDALYASIQLDGSRNQTNSDFIQPGLSQLQPNLDDFFMELDCTTALPDWQVSKLMSIQETSEGSSGQAGDSGYQQQQQPQQQQALEQQKPMNNSNMMNYQALNLQQQQSTSQQSSSQSNSCSTLLMGSTPAQFVPNQPQAAPMPILLQPPSQQPQQPATMHSNDMYSYTAQKKLIGPITCTSEKRHSPKH